MSAAKLHPLRAVAHPAWGAALGLLVLNDHVLKGAHVLPGWLTGKLSDFAGLYVAGVLFAALTRARTSRRVALANVVVGAGFTAFKAIPALSVAASAVYGVAGLKWHLVNDLTDLMALPTLVAAYLVTVRVGAVEGPKARVVIARGLAGVGLAACIASQGPPPTEQPLPCGGDQDCDGDGVKAPTDCNDNDPLVYPGHGCPDPTSEEVCDDGVDNDKNGQTDCEDPACAFACKDIESACGDAVIVDVANAPSLMGSTLGGTSVTDGSCIGTDSPEVLFASGVSKDGELTIGVPAGHGVWVRRNCVDKFDELACNDGSALNSIVTVPLVAGDYLTIGVEAIDPFQAGKFTAPLSFHPIGCGDGKRVDPEQCDDGNNVDGDGCDANCNAETGPLCSAMPILNTGTTMGDFMTGATTVFKGTCAGSYDTKERGFRYVATTTSLSIDVASSADISLYANSGACPGTPAGCVEKHSAGLGESLKLVTTPGDEYTIFVELAPGAPEDATFALTLTDPAP